MKHLSRLVLIAGALALAACSLTTNPNQTSTDPAAAQSFFPQIAGYDATTTDSIRTAITTTLGSAGLLTGNLVQAALVAKVDDMIRCYQQVGAADARIYTQRINITEPTVPIAGVLAIINQDRIRENFLGCALRNPLTGFGAQAAEPEPCYGYGTFAFNEDRISYLFAATDQPLCDRFAQHFAPYNPTGGGGRIVLP